MQESINRGLRMGIVLLGLFFLSAGAVYLLAGVAGVDDNGQIVIAACLGPLLGSLVFGGWWLQQRASNVQEQLNDE